MSKLSGTARAGVSILILYFPSCPSASCTSVPASRSSAIGSSITRGSEGALAGLPSLLEDAPPELAVS